MTEEAIFKLNKIEFEFKDYIQARLYGRTQNNKKICLNKKTYDYIYCNIENIESSKIIKAFEKNKEFKKRIKFETIDAEISDINTKLLKIITQNLEDSEKIKEIIKTKFKIDIFEDDLEFEKKFLLENHFEYNKNYLVKFETETHNFNVDIFGKLTYIEKLEDKSIDINYKSLYFDIETYDSGEIDYKANPILMISFYSKNLEKVFVSKIYEAKKNVEVFRSELDMLIAVDEFIKDFKPDIISGYNIKGFDLPYLIERFNMFGIKFNIGSDYTNIKILKNKRAFSIEGIQILDFYQLIRNLMRFSVKGSLSLNNVSKELLGDSKKEVELKDLTKIWTTKFSAEEMNEFTDYCLKDSLLCYELYNYFKYDLNEFSFMINANYEDLSTYSSSQIVEAYLMTNARAFNQIIPPRPDNENIRIRRERHIQGAFVFDPIAGFYKNILIYDFTSLYPTIIGAYNITKGSIRLKEEENTIKVPERPYSVCQKKKNFIPSIIENVVERRIRIKELIKQEKDPAKIKQLNSRLNTLKIIANSMYGYLIFYMSRWYSYEAGEAVTSFARFNIKKVISKFQEKKFEVIYSDTDSVFVLDSKNNKENIEKIVEKINKELPGLMHLEFEDRFEKGIFVSQKGSSKGAKKKYALLKKNGEFKIAGMALVRDDWSELAKEIQKQSIEILLKEEDTEKAINYVKEEIKNLGEKEINKFIIKTKLTKKPDEYESKGPHVIVAEKMIEEGKRVRVGTSIEYVIKKGDSKRIGDRAEIPKKTKVEEIDFEYYINNQIIPVLESIFEVFNININEEVNKKNKSLSDFF